MKKNILSIATGKTVYVDMAINLIRSFLWWHPHTSINFQLVTDQPWLLPDEIKNKIEVIKIQINQYGNGFSTKLHLDKFAKDGQTLFIDSDCLIFGPLEPLFEKFKGHTVSVVGDYIKDGEWFGDVKKICASHKIDKLPKFNGGIYYLEKGDLATKLYRDARMIEQRYDEIGFIRLRNQPNDEVIMALSMQLNNQKPIIDDGSIMSDLQACQGSYNLDVINGKANLYNPPYPNPKYQKWYPFERVSPLIVHFLGDYTSDYPYKLESYKLNLALSGKLSPLSIISINVKIKYVSQFRIFLKNTFRPIYRKLFGLRTIKASERN